MVKHWIALVALGTAASAFAAGESLSKVDSSKGEILLEVQGMGEATQKAAKISTFCELSGYADTREEAEKAAKTAKDELNAEFKSARIASAQLDVSPTASFSEYGVAKVEVVNIPAAGAAEAAAADGRNPQIQYSYRVGMSAKTGADYKAAHSVLSLYGCHEDDVYNRRPEVEIADPAGLKRRAADSALRAAQSQAEGYASSLGLKVLRIVRVSEVSYMSEMFGPEYQAMMREIRFSRNHEDSDPSEVKMSHSVVVDFVLGPG